MGVIAVTGASGFIGTRLVNHLCRDHFGVRIMLRSQDQKRQFANLPLEFVFGDLGNPGALAQLTENTAAVIHCAGSVRGRALSDFEPANITGLTKLASTMRVHSRPTPLLVLSSLAAREPDLSYYAYSKREGESVLSKEFSDLDWTILRPAAVYGPGDKELLPLLRLMARGIAILPGSAESRVSLLHVNDLVAAIRRWIDSPPPPHEIFEIDDGTINGYSWNEIATTAGQLRQRTVRLLRVPPRLLNSLAATNLWLADRLGYQPMLTPGKLRELRHPDWSCNSRPFQDATGWRPRLSLADGLRATPGWRR